jgi:hypothetical protein
MPPGDTWLGVLLQGLITAVVSGLLAGLVAFLTVRWTQRGDAVRARLVASQAAALVLQRETRDAMHTIHAHLVGSNVIEAGYRQVQWREEMLLQRPVIISEPLRALIDQYASVLNEMHERTLTALSDERAYTQTEEGDDVTRVEVVVWVRKIGDLVRSYAVNLDAALAAHRADQPLPAALPDPEWPELRFT